MRLNIPSFTVNVNVQPSTQQYQQPTYAQSSAQYQTGPFDERTWYRLKNVYHPTESLDVINDKGTNSAGLLQLARDDDVSGQHWQIKSNGDGTYALRTMFLGPFRHLDVYGDAKKLPVLQPGGDFSGQCWVIEPWGDGTWHLANTYSGSSMYLDSKKRGSKVKLKGSDCDRATQRWTITSICEISETGF